MNKKNQKNIKGFIKTLHSILETEEYQTIIQRTKENNGFTILDQEAFEKNIIPQHYNMKNFDSFRRSLNLYGFQGKKNQQGYKTYVNKILLDQPLERCSEKNPLIGKEELLDSENLALVMELGKLQEEQQTMMKQIQMLLEQQQQISNQMQRVLIQYTKGAIREITLSRKMSRFVYGFCFSLQNRQYKRFLKKKFKEVIAAFNNQSSELSEEIKLQNTIPFLFIQQLQQFKLTLQFNIQDLFNKDNQIDNSFWLENDSNLSNFFCLNMK